MGAIRGVSSRLSHFCGIILTMRSVVYAIPFIFITLTSHGSGLELSSAPVPETLSTTPLLSGQIPHSKAAGGSGAIAMAYLSSPTKRYAHGVLGDKIEAASLTLVLDDGKELRYDLPETRVFEDLQPRFGNFLGSEVEL